MDFWAKEQEVKLNNEVIPCSIAWYLKKKGFEWPGYSARMYLKPISDGTWFYDNTYMSEAAAPTRGLLKHWLKKIHNIHINFRLTDEDFIKALDTLPNL